MDKVEEIFEEQLRKCGVDYFDFYLFHNVCELNIDAYLDEKNGIPAYLLEQKKAGRIRHLGFSAHGGYDTIKRFLDAYGDEMEFGQLQLNYLDWDFQDSKAKAELLEERGIPVWSMEPLRGGSLAKLPEEYAARLEKARPDETVPAWAFRFLQSLPSVTVTLSGMSNMEQLIANIETYEREKPLSEPEFTLLREVAKGLVEGIAVPCTACRYCTSHCPQQLDIPNLLSLYNEHSFTGGGFIAPMALAAIPEERKPAACIGCKNCEAVCPQQIKIADTLADFTRQLGA
jgi:predicted aldo/keto reductase-like oxidoreductase